MIPLVRSVGRSERLLFSLGQVLLALCVWPQVVDRMILEVALSLFVQSWVVGRGSGVLIGIPGSGGGFFLANACSSSAAVGVFALNSF